MNYIIIFREILCYGVEELEEDGYDIINIECFFDEIFEGCGMMMIFD